MDDEEVVSTHPLEDDGEMKLTRLNLELKAAMKQLREECSHLPTPPTPEKNSPLSVLLRHRQLQAEITAWKQQQDRMLTVAEYREGGAELRRSFHRMQEALEAMKKEKRALTNQLQQEEKLLMEEQLSAKLIEAKMEEVLKGRTKKGKQSTDSSLLLKNKLEKLSGGLYQHLEMFIEEHLTLPDDEDGPAHETLITFLKDLIGRCLNSSPHQDPYLPISRISEDHLQLLLRSGVLQRHPDHPSTLVRLTPYHH